MSSHALNVTQYARENAPAFEYTRENAPAFDEEI